MTDDIESFEDLAELAFFVDDPSEMTIDDEIESLSRFTASGHWSVAAAYLGSIITRTTTRDAILDLAEELDAEREAAENKISAALDRTSERWARLEAATKAAERSGPT